METGADDSPTRCGSKTDRESSAQCEPVKGMSTWFVKLGSNVSNNNKTNLIIGFSRSKADQHHRSGDGEGQGKVKPVGQPSQTLQYWLSGQ